MDSVAINFLLLDAGIVAMNAIADRPLGRNCSALWLSAGLMFGQALVVLLGLTVDRPWRWAASGLVDLTLLVGAVAAIRQGPRAYWACWLALCLMVGLALQVALWSAWLPHQAEPYNTAIYGIFLQYVRVSRILASLELFFVALPGVWGVAVLVGRCLGPLYRVPRVRHQDR